MKLGEGLKLLKENLAEVVMVMIAGVKQLTFGTIHRSLTQLVNPQQCEQ